MNISKNINFSDNINKVILQIESYIKENATELFFKPESVKRVITDNYIYYLITENEHVANDFLTKIEGNLTIYNKNTITKNIKIIKDEINGSINKLFINSTRISLRKNNKIKKERVIPLISNYISGVYFIKSGNKSIFLQINNESSIYKYIDYNGEVFLFPNKKELINKLKFFISDNDKDDFLNLKFYNEREYIYYFDTSESWRVNNEYILNELINQIKLKRQIDINNVLSIELKESYSYKSVFIINDKVNRKEKVLHVYTADLEEAFSIAKSEYNQIKENGEQLIYKIKNDWYSTKMESSSVKRFSQYKNLLKPLEKIMSRVNLISSTETNYDFSHLYPLSGLCYGLSLKYLTEVRNNGLEGGNQYLDWLKKSVEYYSNRQLVYNDKLDEVIFNRLQEYGILNLIKEVKNITFAQFYQSERLGNAIKYIIYDSVKQNEYSQIINDKGLEPIEIKKIELNKENVINKIEDIVKKNENYYSVIALKDHAFAVTYKRYSDNNYKLSLFDSNNTLLEFNNIEPFKKSIKHKIDLYGGDKDKREKYIIFDEYKESEVKNYRHAREYSTIENNKGIADSIKKLGFGLPFKEGVIGRVIHYSEQKDLIVELKIESKIVEVIVKDTYVDSGINLIKQYIDKIIENNAASKVVLNKTDGNIDILAVEFNEKNEIKKQSGYVDFDGEYYKNLLEINVNLLNGKKAIALREIINHINTLEGNVYFEKLSASFSLINKIKLFNDENKKLSLVSILSKIKEKLEGKLFYDKFIYGKDKLISLAEKNSLVAAKFYQLMNAEINDENYGISNFIYNQMIESPYLELDKERSKGIDGYDYTIVFKKYDNYLSTIIKNINIPELKNTLVVDGLNVLHLKDNYQSLLEYRDDENVNKLICLIENEIKLKKGDLLGSYRELYFDYFKNNNFINRMITHEINQLELYYNNSYREHNYSYHPDNFYIDEDNESFLLNRALNENKNNIDSSYLLFDDSVENLNFLFKDNDFFSNKNLNNVIIDSINNFYHDDIIAYYYNNVKSEKLARYLNDKPEISNLLDYCLKNKIRVIAVGRDDYGLFHQDFVKQKNDIEYLQNIIIENQFLNEKTLIFTKKERLLSHQYGNLFIEGIAQRFNLPIYQVINNHLSLLREYIAIKPQIERHHIDKPLLASAYPSSVIITEAEEDDFIKHSINQKNNIENEIYTKKIYIMLSDMYPNFRESSDFYLGYKKDISSVISDYTSNMTMNDIFEYIKLNRGELDLQKIGTIVRKVDKENREKNKEILKKVCDEIIDGKISIESAYHRYFYELSVFFMSNNKKDIIIKITQALYDPLINKNFNQYLIGKIDINNWEEINNLSRKILNLTEKTERVIELIHAIYDNPTILNKLSQLSKDLLASFFDDNSKGVLYHILLDSISTCDNYKKIINDLNYLIALNKNSKVFELLTPAMALEKSYDIKIANKSGVESIFGLKNSLDSRKNNKITYKLIPIFSLYNDINSSNNITMLYTILKNKYSHNDILSNLILTEELFHNVDSSQLNETHRKYLSSFEKVITELSKFDIVTDYSSLLMYGHLYDGVSSLTDGSYLLDIDSTLQKINITVERTSDGDIKYNLFSNRFGNIEIKGKDKKQATLDLFSYLTKTIELTTVEGNNPLDIYQLKGAIYQVDLSEERVLKLFDDFMVNGRNINSEHNDNENKIKISDISIDKKLLAKLGAKINNVNILNVDLDENERWMSKLTLDARNLNDYFLSITGDKIDKEVILFLHYLLNNKKDKIKNILNTNSNRIDYLIASSQLAKIIELNNKNYNNDDWNSLRDFSLKTPRYMKIISKIGYANISYSIWQSINSTFSLAEQLNNPQLTSQERKEIITNLSIMWSEMAYNGISEIIEIALAKGLLKYRNNPAAFASKISTRVGIGLNVLSVSFDIYNAYDNFHRISGENDEKRRIDYIVNGSFAIVSGLVTLGVSIGMLAGSTVAGPVGIVAGIVISLATSIYNAARVIEEAKKKVSFTALEEFNNGFHVFLMGDLTPSKKNEVVYLETTNQLEEMADENALSYFSEIKKQNSNSYYFYTNEKYSYEEHYYYKVVLNLLNKTLDEILISLSSHIVERLSKKIEKEAAEYIASFSYHLRAEKTDYKYYIPKDAIPTDETLIFDIDFYVDELKKYTLDIISDDNSPVYDEIIDKHFLEKIISSKENVIKEFGKGKLSGDIIKSNNNKTYYLLDSKENDEFHFNTNNGNDIISAPLKSKNIFNIYNGTKRLSGGNNDDMFNLFVSKSPNYASRFYGRGGNDTLRIIKTTNKYNGYDINLTQNYVRFKNSEDETNSQNFHSKLFLYQENNHIYSKHLIDSMPNVQLQNKKVIAYLDRIENVIGSETGDDIIVGNQEDNYLNGVGAVDFLYGLSGNDTLVLQEGYAEGGEGNDTYIINKYSSVNPENRVIEIIISESSKAETSIVRLNYSFDEIKSISRNGKDISFIIKRKNEKENLAAGMLYHSIILRNVYKDSNGEELAHCYVLTTIDGFMLGVNDYKEKTEEALYTFSYLENYNQTEENIEYLYLNDINHSLMIKYADYDKKIKLIPKLKYSGFSSGENIKFNINSNYLNNKYFGITANSIIKLSSGHDNYQLKTFLSKNKKDIIDIFPLENSDELMKNSSSTFFLSDVSGFDLKYENDILSHRYNPDAYLKLHFDNASSNIMLDSELIIRLIDKDNIIFTLPNKYNNHRLLMPNFNLNLKISSNDDVLMIPKGMILNKEALSSYSISSANSKLLPVFNTLNNKIMLDLLPILELEEGNDILVNHNNSFSVVDGGNGDDHIVVNSGHHILIAGMGNDNINAGSGNDLLISQSGDDYLSGGEGDNTYIIQKRQGNITVYDQGENSHIVVTGLSAQDKLISSQVGDDVQYRTQDNQFVLTLKTDKKASNQSVTLVEKQSVLSTQAIASIIHEMAQFNEQQLTTMQGSELIPSSTWSPLSLVTTHL
ncbi:calcium-binding protein [Proteus hauseri]|uniref:calcium-binding protein n=1 Tax=Proteus hauseri TaxID=183417 RepID=UPI0032DA6C1D